MKLNMKEIELRNVKGCVDYSPREQYIRNYISDTLKKVFEKIVGTGPGSGMGLLFVIAGIVGIIMTLVFYNNRYIKLLDQ